MSLSADFEGTIVVDGIVRSHGVGVFLYDCGLVLSEIPRVGLCRFKIYLRPFSPSMILTQNADCMKEGLFFEFKGNDVGVVSDGPLGNPGDGEFNSRTIIVFRTTVTYIANLTEVKIDGETTSGVDAYNANKVLQAGKFSVHFAIPKERFAKFFQLNEFAHSNLLRAFAQAFP